MCRTVTAVDGSATETLHLGATAARRLEQFAVALRSSPHNLLSPRGLTELELRHVPECLGLAALLPGPGRVLDVGTGGGLPGLVVAIARDDLDVTLLDATAKKVRFVEETAEMLGVRVRTLTGRAEDLVRDRAGTFDVVTARAVAPLERLLPWTLPWLRPGGRLYAVKGERYAEELRAALPLLRRTGARVVDVTEPGRPVPTEPSAAPDGITPRVVIIRSPG